MGDVICMDQWLYTVGVKRAVNWRCGQVRLALKVMLTRLSIQMRYEFSRCEASFSSAPVCVVGQS